MGRQWQQRGTLPGLDPLHTWHGTQSLPHSWLLCWEPDCSAILDLSTATLLFPSVFRRERRKEDRFLHASFHLLGKGVMQENSRAHESERNLHVVKRQPRSPGPPKEGDGPHTSIFQIIKVPAQLHLDLFP